MNCKEFVDFLMAYLDGELPQLQRQAFEQHIVDCPPCVLYLDSYKETVRLGQGLSEPPGPEEAPEDLVQAILAVRSCRS